MKKLINKKKKKQTREEIMGKIKEWFGETTALSPSLKISSVVFSPIEVKLTEFAWHPCFFSCTIKTCEHYRTVLRVCGVQSK